MDASQWDFVVLIGQPNGMERPVERNCRLESPKVPAPGAKLAMGNKFMV